MPNLIHGQDPGGTLKPIQVDDNGNLSVDIVSGVSVSVTVGTITSITDTVTVRQVSGSADSTVVNSFDTSILANQVSGSNFSTEVSGVARTTNPTAVADAASVKASYDDLGRQVITPYQVRDLVSTANVATSTGIETTLLAAVAGVNLDLVQIVCANTSDAAVDVDIRSVTAGAIEFSLTVPADSTAGFVPVVPWPQVNTGNNWTVDVGGSDISNTTVNTSALFIRNI